MAATEGSCCIKRADPKIGRDERDVRQNDVFHFAGLPRPRPFINVHDYEIQTKP